MSIFQEYKSSLKAVEVEEVFDLIFYRPLAFILVKAIFSTNITPNQLTIVSLFLGVLGGISIGLGTPTSFIVGALLIISFNILDCSDGQLARLKGNGTQLGRILDGFSDYIVATTVYLGIGFGFANNSANPMAMWGLMIAAAVSNIIHAILLDFYRNRFLDFTLERASVLDDGLDEFQKEYEELKNQKGRIFEKFIIWIYIKYSSFQNKLTSGKSNNKNHQVSSKEYYKKNKILIHLWTYLGPTTQWTFFVTCAILNRIDIYLWGLVIVFNSVAVILYALQTKNDFQLKLKEA